MTARLLTFPVRPRILTCVSCGSHFRPRAAHHERCWTCFNWRRALLHLMAADRAFSQLRERR
jgi:hypothetical protein